MPHPGDFPWIRGGAVQGSLAVVILRRGDDGRLDSMRGRDPPETL